MMAVMRIIALKTLKDHWQKPHRSDSEQPLKAWYAVAEDADWNEPSKVKDQFGNASFVGDRVVFNIAGNKYRLVVWINYPYRVIYIRFIGTHAEYNAIDVRNI